MPAAPGLANPDAQAAAPPAALPPAIVNAPNVPEVEIAPTVSRVLVQRGWENAGRGHFYYPSSDFPRIHIVLGADAAYHPRYNLYKDVKTVEVQDNAQGGAVVSHTFWLDDVKQRYDNVRLNLACGLLAAQARVILNDVLSENENA